MPDWVSRYLGLDDLWSVLGFALVFGVSRLVGSPMPPETVSLLASGMLAIYWFASEGLRARNAERHPNLRVAFWAIIAVASGVLVAR